MRFWKKGDQIKKLHEEREARVRKTKARIREMLESSKAEKYYNRVFVTSKGDSRYEVKPGGELFKNGKPLLDREGQPVLVSHVVGVPKYMQGTSTPLDVHNMMVGYDDEVIISTIAHHNVEPKEGTSALFLKEDGKKVHSITSDIHKIE